MEEENIDEKMSRLIGSPKRASSYLFYVSDNDTTDLIVKYFEKCLNLQVGDLSEIRPEDSLGKKKIISIKQIRELTHFINLSPSGDAKVAIVSGAEYMNRESANAFLKTLEEPPKSAIIILFAFRDTLLPTIKSRCEIVNLRSANLNSVDFDKEVIAGISGNFKDTGDLLETVIKEERTDEFLDSLQEFARSILHQKTTVGSAEFLKKIEKARREIGHNANAKLTLESLILSNREIIRENIE